MFIEVRNAHEKAREFISYVLSVAPDATIRQYELSTYIETSKRIINFLSSVSHDLVMITKGPDGDLLSFPLEMFGTIYEL